MKRHYAALAIAMTSYTSTSFAETVVALDWVEMSKLTSAQKGNIAPYCTGSFVSPILDSNPTVRVQYDTAQANLNGSSDFYGNVTLVGEELLAQTNQLTLDQNNSSASLVNDALIRFTGIALSSNNAQISTDGHWANAEQPDFVLHDNDMHGSASYITRDEAFTVATDVNLTRCAPTDNAWTLKATELTIDNEKRYAKAWHTQLKVKDVPIFYWPYIAFPLDNQRFTGFLTPTFGFGDGQLVSEFYLPFYINLASNYDDTVAVHYTASQGTLINNEFRFLTDNHNGENTLAVSIIEAEDTSSEADQYRWNIQHQQSGKLTTNTVYDFNTNWVSDVNYEQVFASETEATSEQVLNASITNKAGRFTNTLLLNYTQPVADSDEDEYLFKEYELTAGVKTGSWQTSLYGEYHSVYDEENRPVEASDYEYKRQPELTIKHGSDWFGNLKTAEQVRVAYFDRNLPSDEVSSLAETDLSLNNTVTRVHSQVTLSNPLVANWGYFKPSVTGYYSTYQTANELFSQYPDSDAATDNLYTDRLLWSATFDQALTFENPGTEVDITFSPRVHYTYTPFVTQENDVLQETEELSYELFQTTRFDTIDRLGDMNRLSTSLSSDFSSAQNGRTFASVSLEKGVKLSQERITLSDADAAEETDLEFSTWQLNASLTPNDSVTFSSQLEFEHDDLSLGDYNINASYRPEEKVFASLNLTQEDSEREIGFASYFPIKPNIALIGYAVVGNDQEDSSFANYSFEEIVYGVDYDSCCWSIRVAGYNTAVDDDQSDTFFPLETTQGVYFEFTLKGIGASVGSIENFLTNLDIGYSGKMFNYQ